MGELTVAFLASTASYLLPPVVQAFRERYPDVRLTTEDTSVATLVDGLRDGRYDAAFSRPPLVDGLAARSLWPPWHRKYDEDFRRAGYEPDVVQRAGSVQNLLGLVAAGVGVSRLARSAHSLRRTGVVFVPLAGEQAATQVLWLPDADKPALRRLLEVVTELAARTDLTQSGYSAGTPVAP
ncbi:LysR family substrate-binding domain-containing protein [Amycolatopsis methanolica]|uniref:LysR family substrate-binding domain-containing protein n=2 Tax=Amycolatopsis methanolica TaxID=1814 RepID=UPI00036E495D